MTVLQIVRAGLKAGNYDGLYNRVEGFGGGKCHCSLDELSPDGCLNDACQAAYQDEFHNWVAAPDLAAK